MHEVLVRHRRLGPMVRLSVVALLASLLQVLGTAPANAAVPYGDVNFVVSQNPGQVYARGWAYDEDDLSASVGIEITLGPSYGNYLGLAQTYRPDVNDANPGAGVNHGFDAIFDVPVVGDLDWRVYTIDPQDGARRLLEEGRVTIADPSPTGAIESASSTAHRTLDIAGWASDPNAPSTPTAVGVYIGGPVGTPGVEVTRVPANIVRSDGKQGFSARLNTAKTGSQPVYVYAANVPGTPGSDAFIGSTNVTILVDTTPPQTTIDSAPTVATPSDAITITFSANEANSTFTCRWDDATFSTCKSGTPTSLTPGQHIFEVRATDAYSNTDPTPAATRIDVTDYVTQPPLPGTQRSIRASTAKKKSKLRINVDPDSADRNYRVVIQRKVGKRWRKVDRVRTRGDNDVVTLNLRRGKYRAKLPKSSDGPALTSNAVRLRR